AGQAPLFQTMMANYIDQSKNMFVQMQEQMQQQTRNMFQGFPFQAPSGDAGDREEGKS
ncbi:MAG: polyhydroxyalkanoate synthesis repressor PhaR, partial [Betaproteobacteria bacterium]|nr:polyhydroxyalkanoate synthesis repressor PhaR [Betaproteobacteria bacterium]